MTGKNDGLSFNKEEAKVLRQIVEDWLNEELVVPPYTPAIQAVLRKLNLASPALAEAASVAANEVTIRPGPRSE